MQNSLASLLANTKSLLILLPTNPHFDQVAAGLSLFVSVQKHKEDLLKPPFDIQIACPSPMLVEFNRLVGVDRVASQLGDKNLIIRFAGYPVDDLEKVSYEIENNEIKIKVEPKVGVAAPRQDQVNISYAGVSADTILLIGGLHEGHFPALTQQKELSGARIAHVGTKDITLPQPFEVLSLARPASSISELIGSYLKQAAIEIDADVATNLLMGIEEGSRNFTTADTTAETFGLVSDLMRAGGKRWTKSERPDRRNFPPGAIPRQPLIPMEPIQQRPTQPKAFEAPRQQQNKPEEEAQGGDVPQSWFEPKIYKSSGTPIS